MPVLRQVLRARRAPGEAQEDPHWREAVPLRAVWETLQPEVQLKGALEDSSET